MDHPAPSGPRRRTKIVATLGPATDPPEVLDALLAAGVDCVRVNCSHGTQQELRDRTAAARQAAQRAGRPVGVLFDLQGPKLRLVAATEVRAFAVGEETSFGGPGSRAELVLGFDAFSGLVTPRSEIVIGDGLPRFAVVAVEEDHVRARALTAGLVSGGKGVNVTYARPNLPAITDKDVDDLTLAAELDADFVALSFVRGAGDVIDLARRLRAFGSRARTIAKIEKVEAYEHLDEILAVSDGVMVARGDYGVEAGVARVPLMQKDTIRRATQAGKVVITATQMLESMIRAPEPTRAEATDVANAVIDGTSAVMLSAETGIGEFPVQAVLAMGEIALVAEGAPEIIGRARAVGEDATAAMVVHAAEQLASELGAAAIIIPTSTGGGARAAAKYRPGRPILAFFHEPQVGCQLALEWGVVPIAMEIADTVDELVEWCLEAARDHVGLPAGASVVLTAGRRTGTPGATSLIMVRDIP